VQAVRQLRLAENKEVHRARDGRYRHLCEGWPHVWATPFDGWFAGGGAVNRMSRRFELCDQGLPRGVGGCECEIHVGRRLVWVVLPAVAREPGRWDRAPRLCGTCRRALSMMRGGSGGALNRISRRFERCE
jgi:hypothetical protein